MNFTHLTEERAELDYYRNTGEGLPPGLVKNLEDWFRVELTYTSNAIEGNTLTRRETALVVEKGLTVGGKSLQEHLEASNHAYALDWIRDLAKRPDAAPSENELLQLHSLILQGIDNSHAGRYRDVTVMISGSSVVLPNPFKVPALMEEFIQWLSTSNDLHPVELAAEAHYRLVTIHPFIDGNGRTARLLMNLILISHGYPPAIIRKRDRLAYIGSLEKAQLGGTLDDYLKIITKAVDRSLNIYLKAIKGKDLTSPEEHQELFKIGAIAKHAEETVPTIRYWTKEGLLNVAERTASNYALYAPETLARIQQIQELKKQRFTLSEIKERLFSDNP
jgi:Fic family protein